MGLQAGLVGFCAAAVFRSRTYGILPYLLCGLSAALFHVSRRRADGVDFSFGWLDARNIGVLSFACLVLVQIAMKTWL